METKESILNGKVELRKILNCGYYDDTKKYVVELDREKLKKIFNADIVEIR